MSVLRLEHVTKRFGGLVAVNDLSFEVKERQIHALIGPNGSGKSTSINMINGSFPVTSGKIYFNDKDITGWKMHKIAAAGMGRTYQNLKLFRSMTALENVMIGGQLHAKMNFARFLIDPFKTKREEEELREKAMEIMRFIGIEQYADRTVGNLPYGRQKMTELARTLMIDPTLILLDEPAAGLNPNERAEFVAIIKKVYESGKDILLIEQQDGGCGTVTPSARSMHLGQAGVDIQLRGGKFGDLDQIRHAGILSIFGIPYYSTLRAAMQEAGGARSK